MIEFGKISQNHTRIGAAIILRAEFIQRRGHVTLHQLLEQIDDPCPIGKPEHITQITAGDLAAAMRNGLVENRQGVACRSFSRSGDCGQGFVINGDILETSDFF